MERALWVLALVLLAALVFFGMYRGWRNRARRQQDVPEFPTAPGAMVEDLLTPVTGLYVGTTRSGDWQDRIVVGDIGHRANATAHASADGVLLDRDGASSVWIPKQSIVDARVDHKLANKVVPGAGLLVVTWQLGAHTLDTGFRSDDTPNQREWANTIAGLAHREDDGHDGDRTENGSTAVSQSESASARQEGEE
ncbi:PH-like domain-containing protein [Allosaccharopolyspora coralli]|uniref:PH-like domain-containing protein n=1 Tax=Allosaccharopolyspora coralli TaxID=2665642 RepID=UPI0016520216|nr:transporter [Allosaccharopolyspora coralli]